MTPATRSTSTSSFVPIPARLTLTMVGPLFYICISIIYNAYFIPFQPFLKALFLIFQNFFYSPGRTLCRREQKGHGCAGKLNDSYKKREKKPAHSGQIHHCAQKERRCVVNADNTRPQHQGMGKDRCRRSHPKHNVQKKPDPPPGTASPDPPAGVITNAQAQAQQEPLPQYLSLSDHIHSHRSSQQT